MTDVKRLLEQATPLPWKVGEPDDDGRIRVLPGWTSAGPSNADLIVYAVNHLPDYLAAVSALEQVVWTSSGHHAQPRREAWDAAREALARLRDEVPA